MKASVDQQALLSHACVAVSWKHIAVKVLSVLGEIITGAQRSQTATVMQRVSRASSVSYSLRHRPVAYGSMPGCVPSTVRSTPQSSWRGG